MTKSAQDYLVLVTDSSKKLCKCSDYDELIRDLSSTIDLLKINTITNESVEHSGTMLLEKSIYIDSEYNGMSPIFNAINVGRVLQINPGSDNIGREQRYVHCYIVLAEIQTMIIAVPITNMAFDKDRREYYLRNDFEVELQNPDSDFKKKPFTEFWCIKPSIADIRNIAGLDKRRIVQNSFFAYPKYAPSTYLIDIRTKMKILFGIV
jgi:hypothetical protein